MIEHHEPVDPRFKVKRAWISSVSERSGDPCDFDLAVEIDAAAVHRADILRVTKSDNQIVIAVRFVRTEGPKE